jgi:ABC-2 type transport system permease protein
MIFPIIRTALVSLRRDRAALALSFILPISFFSIFAVIFGGQRDSTPKIHLILVDEDQSAASQQLVHALERESSLVIMTKPASKEKPATADYTAATAEAAVKAGDAPVALIVPKGFGQNPISFGPRANWLRHSTA